MNRRRIGRGGIAYTYTAEEEKGQDKKKAMKSIIPVIAQILVDMHEGDGEKKLRSGKSATVARNPKIDRLKKLMEDLNK